MTQLEQILLEYAQENMVPAYLVGTGYQRSTAVIELREASIRQLLPDASRKQLEGYLTERMLLESLEQEAHFRAGLRLGLLLSRL